jgi:hypothetical protein
LSELTSIKVVQNYSELVCRELIKFKIVLLRRLTNIYSFKGISKNP